jgi:flagellar hook-length control protein FliK
MSQVANSTATPLIKALPQNSAQAKGRNRTSNTSPSFEEVTASLPHRPANQHGEKSHKPTDTTLTADGKRKNAPVDAKKHTPTDAALATVIPPHPANEKKSAPVASKLHAPIDATLTAGVPSQQAKEGSSTPVAANSHTPTDTTPTQSRAPIAGAVRGRSDATTASSADSSSRIASRGSNTSSTPASSEAGLAVATPTTGDTKRGAATVSDTTQNAVKNSASVSESSQLSSSASSKVVSGGQSVTGRRLAQSPNLTVDTASAHRSSVPASTNASFETVASRSAANRETPANGSVVQLNAANALQHLDNLSSVSTPTAASTGETVASAPLGQLGNIVAQVVREGNLPRTITISLEPKDLGQLQLQVTSNGGDIQVHIQVADPTTRGMVSQQLADLTSALNRDLGFGGQQRGSRQGSPQRSSQSSDGVVDLGAVATIDTPVGSSTASATHSLIDVRI